MTIFYLTILILTNNLVAPIIALIIFILSTVFGIIGLYVKQVKDITDLQIKIISNHENVNLKIKAMEQDIQSRYENTKEVTARMENAIQRQIDTDEKLLFILNDLRIVVSSLNEKINNINK